jgi:hypothetical protein
MYNVKTTYPPEPPKDFNEWMHHIAKLLNQIK